MPIALNFKSIYSKEWEINFTQCNPKGVLKHTELCSILQFTAATHSEMGGISFSDMQEYNQAWVLSKMRIEINALPKWKDKITVTTWINSFENSRSVRAFEVAINGLKIAGATSFWVVFNTKTRKPQTLILPYQHFELFPDKKTTDQTFSRINITVERESVLNKSVVLSDLDIVNHVNNVKYLEWCLDLVDENFILNANIASFEMNYLKELSIKDRICIYKNKTNNQTIFSITKEDKNCFALAIYWK